MILSRIMSPYPLLVFEMTIFWISIQSGTEFYFFDESSGEEKKDLIITDRKRWGSVGWGPQGMTTTGDGRLGKGRTCVCSDTFGFGVAHAGRGGMN